MVRSLPIGLDIGSTTVRLLQLGGAERDLRVIHAARFVIPNEVKFDPKRSRPWIVETVRRLIRQRRFRGREAVMALAPDALAVRNIRLPKMPEEELATAVTWEAQNKFPFDTATAVIQHLLAGEIRQGDQTLDEVILLAAPRLEVEARLQLACEAGVDLVSLDAEPCAIFRGFERFLHRREDEAAVSIFVDLGAKTTVVIARGRHIVFIKTIPIGGAVFNRAVAENLELSLAEAEALRRRIAGRRRAQAADRQEADRAEADRVDRAVHDAIRPHLEDLTNEIGLCLRYYGVTFRGTPPGAVTLTGGESHNAAISETMAERLGLPVRVGDPFRGVRTDHLGPILDRRGVLGEWTTAFGLSLKGFHLASQPATGWAA